MVVAVTPVTTYPPVNVAEATNTAPELGTTRVSPTWGSTDQGFEQVKMMPTVEPLPLTVIVEAPGSTPRFAPPEAAMPAATKPPAPRTVETNRSGQAAAAPSATSENALAAPPSARISPFTVPV